MQAIRLETNLRNQTPEAQTVYSCVPVNKAWSAQDVRREYMRTRPPVELKVIAGCLYALKDVGLVNEVEKGTWQRVTVPHAGEMNVAEPTPIRKTLHVPAKKAVDTTDPLALIADITSRMKGLLNELDDAAIAVTEAMKESERKSEQLTQLKALLKGIAD